MRSRASLLISLAVVVTLGGCKLRRLPPGPPEEAIAWGPFAGMVVVRLRNGANDVDLDGDGGLDMVFSAWRENHDAHGYTETTFYWSKRDSVPGARWQLVPFLDAHDVPRFDAFHTVEGADCMLSDLRLLRPPDGKRGTTVVAAERAMGRSYADSAAVSFTVYELGTSAAGQAGSPSRWFHVARTFASRGRYCDVGDAFARELAIPRDTTSGG